MTSVFILVICNAAKIILIKTACGIFYCIQDAKFIKTTIILNVFVLKLIEISANLLALPIKLIVKEKSANYVQ